MSETRILSIIALMIALVVPAGVRAQVPVEVSGEKMIVGSKIYYMHEVLKNQTLYSISKAYKVSIAEIERENVIPVNGIQTGQVLRIPSREDQPAAPSQPRPATPQPAPRSAAAGSTPPAGSLAYDAATGIKLAKERIMYNGKPYYMHEVLKGQTLYSIARAYKVTILEIDRENAIPAGGLQAGQILRIPASTSLVVQEEVPPPPADAQAKPAAATNPQQETAKVQEPATEVKKETAPAKAQEPAAEVKKEAETKPQTETTQKTAATTPPTEAAAQSTTSAPKKAQPEKKKIHKVQKGESLADIAKKYDITVQELKQANKGVIFAMPDMRLVIPVSDDNQ